MADQIAITKYSFCDNAQELLDRNGKLGSAGMGVNRRLIIYKLFDIY